MGIETLDINAKLVERARQGDQQAMYRLYKTHVQAMYNTSIRIVVNQFDAEDIIQESFLSAFKSLGYSLKCVELFFNCMKFPILSATKKIQKI